MDWKDIGQKIAGAAPLLGGLLGGPAGAAVGGIIAATLGSSNDAASVDAAIAANPDALLKLKQIESDQATKLQELTIEAEKNRLSAASADFATEVDDRKNARALAAEQPADKLRPAIVIGLSIAIIGIIVAVFIPSSKDVMKDPVSVSLLSVIVGFVFRDFGTCISFLFGTSREAMKQSNDIAQFAMAPGAVTLTDKEPKQ